LLIQYIDLLQKSGKEEECLSIINLLFHVFQSDKERITELTLIQLGIESNNIALHVRFQNFELLAPKARQFYSESTLKSKTRLFPALFKGVDLHFAGIGESSNAFAHQNTLKQLKRILTKIEESGEPVDPHFYALLGHLLIASKLPASSLSYYEKIDMPSDPVLNLCLGIANLCRAFHKRETRQNRILVGLAYIKLYRKNRVNSAEADFNTGRAFHQIGINNLALLYYQKAAQHKDGEFSRISAYNMHLIYISSGSTEMAQKVLKDYCTL
jgi:hypothetical protein